MDELETIIKNQHNHVRQCLKNIHHGDFDQIASGGDRHFILDIKEANEP